MFRPDRVFQHLEGRFLRRVAQQCSKHVQEYNKLITKQELTNYLFIFQLTAINCHFL